jgi:hypothetical protein
MAKYTVKYGQSIYDIATEQYGSVLGIEYIFRDNDNIDATTVLKAGDVININATSETIFDQSVVDFFKQKTITNTESIDNSTDTILSGFNYGVINTNNQFQIRYINDVMWNRDSRLIMKNGLTENIVVDGDGGTFENTDTATWNISNFPWAPESTENVCDSIFSSLITYEGQNYYCGGISMGAPYLYTSDNAFNLIVFDTYLDVIQGQEYVIDADIYAQAGQFQEGNRGNTSIFVVPEGYDLNELLSYSTFTCPEDPEILTFTKGEISTKFVAKSNQVRIKFLQIIDNDITVSTGGSWLIDNVTLRNSNAIDNDRIVFDQPYQVNREDEYIKVRFNPSTFPEFTDKYILFGDTETSSRIELTELNGEIDFNIYAANGDLVLNHPQKANFGEICEFEISTSTNISTTISKNYHIKVNGVESTISATSNDFSFSIFGGRSLSGDGFDGYVELIEINSDKYEFNEGKDIYITKTN